MDKFEYIDTELEKIALKLQEQIAEFITKTEDDIRAINERLNQTDKRFLLLSSALEDLEEA